MVSAPLPSRLLCGRSALAALGLALATLACGGGGGGTAALGVVGSVRLEESPPESLPSRAPASSPADLRLDDHLYTAVDLGVDSCRHAGKVGEWSDRRDVLRFGPRHDGAALIVGVTAPAGCEVTALVFPAGHSPRLGLRLGAHGSTLELRPGEELALVVAAEHACDYEIAIDIAPGAPPSPATEALAPTATSALFADVLGGPDLLFTPGEVIVSSEGDPGFDPGALQALGLSLVASGGPVGRWRQRHAAAFPAGLSGQQAIADLVRDVRRQSPGLRYVSPNLIVPLSALAGLGAPPPLEPDDPYFQSFQWNLTATRFPQAWNLTTGADDIHIAVMDSGLLTGHPDLAPRLSPWGFDFVSNPVSADDGDGIDPDASDPPQLGIHTIFHGTYVAGVCSAVAGNQIGIAGGTWRGQVLPLRVFGKLGGEVWDLLQALRYAAGLSNASNRVLTVAQRPRVLNMSFTFLPTEALRVEIENAGKAGLFMVSAVGNQGQVNKDPIYPAAWPEVLGIAAVDRQLDRTGYSNAGDFVDLAACGGVGFGTPGGVISTWATYTAPKLDFLWNTFEGTSLATPAVAAAIALMASVNPELDLATVQAIFADTCLDRGPAGKDEFYGWGVLQADAAVQRAKELGPPRLELLPESLTLKDAQSAGELSAVNAGGRLLQDLRIVAKGAPSGASTVSLSSTLAPAQVLARVDRALVKVGSYRDLFELQSNGGNKGFELAFRKPIPPPEPAIVRLWDGDRLVTEAATDAAGSFRLEGNPTGTLRLEVGVDRDRNGQLGDSQEWYLTRTIELPEQALELRQVFVPWRD